MHTCVECEVFVCFILGDEKLCSRTRGGKGDTVDSDWVVNECNIAPLCGFAEGGTIIIIKLITCRASVVEIDINLRHTLIFCTCFEFFAK